MSQECISASKELVVAAALEWSKRQRDEIAASRLVGVVLGIGADRDRRHEAYAQEQYARSQTADAESRFRIAIIELEAAMAAPKSERLINDQA